MDIVDWILKILGGIVDLHTIQEWLKSPTKRKNLFILTIVVLVIFMFYYLMILFYDPGEVALQIPTTTELATPTPLAPSATRTSAFAPLRGASESLSELGFSLEGMESIEVIQSEGPTDTPAAQDSYSLLSPTQAEIIALIRQAETALVLAHQSGDTSQLPAYFSGDANQCVVSMVQSHRAEPSCYLEIVMMGEPKVWFLDWDEGSARVTMTKTERRTDICSNQVKATSYIENHESDPFLVRKDQGQWYIITYPDCSGN